MSIDEATRKETRKPQNFTRDKGSPSRREIRCSGAGRIPLIRKSDRRPHRIFKESQAEGVRKSDIIEDDIDRVCREVHDGRNHSQNSRANRGMTRRAHFGARQ